MKKDLTQILNDLFALRRVGIKYSLDNIKKLLAALGNPQDHWPALHIAGTNGKGSTAAMLESILHSAGYRVGLYTSPHLVRVNERIRVNRVPVPDELFLELVPRLYPLIEQIKPSFFEVLTALAFWYFRECKVEIAVIEVGMGGRLDSTNVVHPLATLITPISMDHQQYLGHSLSSIAAEKAGIIKPGVPCFTNNCHSEILAVLQAKAVEMGSELIRVTEHSQWQVKQQNFHGTVLSLSYGDWQFPDLKIALPGLHQVENALLAVGTIYHLQNKISVQQDAIQKGLQNIHWPGRLQLLQQNPVILLDVAHNPAGFRKIQQWIQACQPAATVRILMGLQEDKDGDAIAGLVARWAEQIWVCPLTEGKPMNPAFLKQKIIQSGGKAELVRDVSEGYEKLKKHLLPSEIGVIIGSHYLAGEVLKIIHLT